MAERAQSYESHRRYVPAYHFFALPVLLINIVVEAVRFGNNRTVYQFWLFVVALALGVFANAARAMVARVQDRVIRIEERTRLARLLPEELRGRIDELRPSHLVALRFASDEEVSGLTQRCLAGEFTKAEQIKKEIKTWRPDHLRM